MLCKITVSDRDCRARNGTVEDQEPPSYCSIIQQRSKAIKLKGSVPRNYKEGISAFAGNTRAKVTMKREIRLKLALA